MINSFSVASSHTAAGAGAGAAAAITLHFNYNNNSNTNNNKNKNSKSNINNNNNNIKIVPATNEHKNHNLINSSAPTTTTTTAKMFKITQSEVVEAKHFLMTYPQQLHQQQQQQQQRAGGSLKWMSPSKINTSASTKEPQFIQVNIQSSTSSNNNNGNNNKKQQLQLTAATTTTTTTAAIAESAFIKAWTMPQQQQQKQRTEDQENAFRQIEDVHNYAKLQHQRHHQQQQLQQLQHSGSSEDEELGEDEEDDDEDEELLDGDLEEEEDYEEEELEQAQIKLELKHKKNQRNVPNKINDEDSEEHVEVDVVTVTPTTPTAAAATAPQLQQQQLQEEEQHPTSTIEQDHMRPEHHARRPMNAFLIFCKRHRAIVKERYKSLENRAITKILGDWWAALDEQEKLCFTELAQLNKDAFFNANPNFKWYKLPAPPLRTLATRPSNAAAAHLNEEQQQTQQQQQQQLLLQHQQQLQWVPNKVAHLLPRPYFKFADETQMGELSVLLSANAANVPDKEYALQQALSETTQFLSAHMPNNNNNNNKNSNNSNKRPVDSASNSSEEEERGSPSKKLKSTRSCKGKIYQELINSGQLAAVAKKSKCRLNSGGSGGSVGSVTNTDPNSSTPPISPAAAAAAGSAQLPTELEASARATPTAHRRSNCETGEFDLEEKIKELPALSLDAYLQRKRSTKKKKKFSSSKKQRNSNSISSNNAIATTAAAAAATVAAAGAASTKAATAAATAGSKLTRRSKLEQLLPAAIAVGSQKRKARKESITRRDVSAIEQEVASILPLTINGCYYFNQTRPQPATAAAGAGAGAGAATGADATCLQQQIVATSPLSSGSSTLSGCEQAPFDVTSTSDLLILAEVAANRTELTKSN